MAQEGNYVCPLRDEWGPAATMNAQDFKLFFRPFCTGLSLAHFISLNRPEGHWGTGEPTCLEEPACFDLASPSYDYSSPSKSTSVLHASSTIRCLKKYKVARWIAVWSRSNVSAACMPQEACSANRAAQCRNWPHFVCHNPLQLTRESNERDERHDQDRDGLGAASSA